MLQASMEPERARAEAAQLKAAQPRQVRALARMQPEPERPEAAQPVQ
jgi:hypothetical protein